MTIQKATPQAITYGINDKSTDLIEAVNEAVPAHLPLIYTLAGWGSYDAELVDGGNSAQYGAGILDNNSPYGTHQTVLAQSLLEVGNPVMLKRVRLEGAKKARIRVAVEVATFLKPIFEYDDDNNIVYQNVGGVSKPVVREYVNGTRLNWHITQTTDRFYPETFRPHGKAVTLTGFRNGNITGPVSEHYPRNTLSHASATLDPKGPMATLNTTLYPILDVELVYDGQYGNQIGLVFSDITSGNSINTTLATSLNAFIYGLQVVEFDPTTQRRRIIPGTNGDSQQSVVFSNDVYNPRTSTIMSIKDVLEQNYDIFGEVHFYKQNYDRVLANALNGRLHNGFTVKGEAEYLIEGTDTLDIHNVMNIVTGTRNTVRPYATFTVDDGPAFGGVRIGPDYPIYGYDGSDGLVYDKAGTPDRLENLRLFDEAVRYELTHFGETGEDLYDMAKYPISTLWDTGFSMDTKKALAGVLGKRRDIYIVFATFTVADYVESVEIIDNRISCAGAINSVFVLSSALDCIYIDEVAFEFPEDTAFQAMGRKLSDYGISLSIVDLDNRREIIDDVGAEEGPGAALRRQGYDIYNYREYFGITGQVFDPARQYGLILENLNPKDQMRVRFRPREAQRFPIEIDTIAHGSYIQRVLVPGDEYLGSSYFNNRTLGYVEGEPGEDMETYQVTVCLDKYVPRAISCVGATPEMAVMLDNTKLYRLEVNGEVRAIGMSVNEIMDVIKTLNATARAYAIDNSGDK